MAPERIKDLPSSVKVDSWALGIILYQLLSGVPPFSGN
jgi:serine/threonine protein kinase